MEHNVMTLWRYVVKNAALQETRTQHALTSSALLFVFL